MNSIRPARLDPFSVLRFLVLVAMAVAALASSAETAARTSSQVRIGKHKLRVEVVDTDERRSRGLMFREKLGRNNGMLFVFDSPGYHAMWMKDTLIPLSVAFIDGDGIILNIRDMEPRTLDTHMAAGPALYAIETNRGWFAKRGIKPGDAVSGLPRGAGLKQGAR